MSQTIITDLPVENKPNSFYCVKVESGPQCFSISLLDENDAYEGEMSSQYISEQSKSMGLTSDEYFEECKNVFFGLINKDLFTFSVNEHCFHMKKKLEEIKIKFGSIKLKPVIYSSLVRNFLNTTLKKSKNNIHEIEKLKLKNKMLKEENKSLIQTLEELQVEKKKMELTLYSKFQSLLNAKKNEIRKMRKKLGIEIEDEIVSDIDNDGIKDENMVMEDVYDVDTDVEENKEDVTIMDKEEEIIKPKENEWRERLVSEDAGNIMKSMAFLDPTVPFDD